MNQDNLDALRSDFDLEFDEYSLKNYLNLTVEDSLKILAIRNHPSIRCRMVNSDVIAEESHLSFVTKLGKKGEGYWVLKKANKILGSISLVQYNKNDASFVVGNFITPEKIGAGFGVAINYFMHYLAFEKVKCKKIKALVKKDNNNAIRVNSIFGAVYIDRIVGEEEISDEYVLIEFSSDLWLSEVKDKVIKIIKYVL